MSSTQPQFEKLNLADSRNFELLYDHYAPILWRHILLRTGSKEDSDEILSQIFLKTWEYVRRRKKVKNIHGFLWTVANRLIVDFYRSKARMRLQFTDFQTLQDTKKEPIVITALEEQLSKKFEARKIISALEFLRNDERMLLTLRFIEELPLEEVAAVYGKSKNATAVAVHRALKRLRGLLDIKFEA